MTKPVTVAKGQEAKATTTLANAQGFIAKRYEASKKLAAALSASTTITADERDAVVTAFKTIRTEASAHRAAVRSEFRATLRTAAEGEEVSDDFKEAADSLNEIINLAENSLDLLDCDEDEGTSAEAAVAEASAEVPAAAPVAEAPAAQPTAEESDALRAEAAKKPAKRKAEEALPEIAEKLTELADLISETLTDGGEDAGEVVNVDENGVEVEDPEVTDLVEEGQTTDVSESELPEVSEEDDDSLTAALSAFLSTEGAHAEASDDPYKGNQPDPLSGKTVSAARRTAARGSASDREDDATLKRIADSLIR